MRDEARLVGLLYRTDWTRLRLSARLSDGSTVVIAPGRRYRFEAAGYATGCDGGRPTICRTADVLLPRTGGRTPGAAFHNRGCRCHRQHDGAGLPEGPGKVVGCGGLPQVFEHAGEIADDRHAGLPVGGFDFGSQGAIPEATEGVFAGKRTPGGVQHLVRAGGGAQSQRGEQWTRRYARLAAQQVRPRPRIAPGSSTARRMPGWPRPSTRAQSWRTGKGRTHLEQPEPVRSLERLPFRPVMRTELAHPRGPGIELLTISVRARGRCSDRMHAVPGIQVAPGRAFSARLKSRPDADRPAGGVGGCLSTQPATWRGGSGPRADGHRHRRATAGQAGVRPPAALSR